MNILSQLQNCAKGTIHTVTYERKVKGSRKTEGHSLEKRSKFQVRFACDYDNLKAVIEKRANGASKGQISGEFTTLVEDFLYERNGEIYVRAYPLKDFHSSTYLLDGREATIEECLNAGYCNSALKSSNPSPDAVWLKLANIVAVC